MKRRDDGDKAATQRRTTTTKWNDGATTVHQQCDGNSDPERRLAGGAASCDKRLGESAAEQPVPISWA